MRSRAIIALLATALAACLPADGRPPPASLLVDATSTDATRDGFVTEDGWSLRFERFVTSLGDIELDDAEDADDSCNDYSEADYTRLFDFSLAVPGKIGIVYGLGSCSPAFEIGPPQFDSLLGEGATAADLEAMRIEDSDAWTHEPERTGFIVQGVAERGGDTKTFDWRFRTQIDGEACTNLSGEESLLELVGEDENERTIEVRGEELFRASPDDDAPLVFDRIADADANDDGQVTLDELRDVELPLTELAATLIDDDEEDLPDDLSDAFEHIGGENLGTLVYVLLLPRVARFAGGGPCKLELFDRRRF